MKIYYEMIVKYKPEKISNLKDNITSEIWFQEFVMKYNPDYIKFIKSIRPEIKKHYSQDISIRDSGIEL